MKKKYLYIGIISTIITILLIVMLILMNKHDYLKALNKANSYLNKNSVELSSIASKMIEEKPSQKERRTHDDFKYNYEIKENSEYVYFELEDIDNISWGLVYSEKDDLVKINVREINYNNFNDGFFITEKIKDHWYFYYDDNEGKTDINSIK